MLISKTELPNLRRPLAVKGNRKVSLTVSGWVAEQVVYWDDGVEFEHVHLRTWNGIREQREFHGNG